MPSPPVPQTKLLTQYVLSLAKYDQNYDIRDRARFTRQLIVPTEQGGTLSRHAKKLFLAPKPAPVLESSFKGGGALHPRGAAEGDQSCPIVPLLRDAATGSGEEVGLSGGP